MHTKRMKEMIQDFLQIAQRLQKEIQFLKKVYLPHVKLEKMTNVHRGQ